MLENPDPTISYPTGKLSCKFNTAQCQLCQVGFPTFWHNSGDGGNDPRPVAPYPKFPVPAPILMTGVRRNLCYPFHNGYRPQHPASRLRDGDISHGGQQGRSGYFLGGAQETGHSAARRAASVAVAAQDHPGRQVPGDGQPGFSGGAARLRRGDGGSAGKLDQPADRGGQPQPASHGVRPQRRMLAGRSAGRRPVRHMPWPRLFRGKHVQPGNRCVEGGARLAGGAIEGRGVRVARLPVHD